MLLQQQRQRRQRRHYEQQQQQQQQRQLYYSIMISTSLLFVLLVNSVMIINDNDNVVVQGFQFNPKYSLLLSLSRRNNNNGKNSYTQTATTSLLFVSSSSSSSNNDDDMMITNNDNNNNNRLNTNNNNVRKVVENLMAIDTNDNGSLLLSMEFIGKTQLPISSNNNNNMIDCVVLTIDNSENSNKPCVIIPLTDTNQLKLLEYSYNSYSNSSSSNYIDLLRNNMRLINRDNGLYDNLPYNTWWIDNDNVITSKDVANNPIPAKFHLGKRYVYNKLLGQDWYKYKLLPEIKQQDKKSIKEMIQDLIQQTKQQQQQQDDDDTFNNEDDTIMMSILQKRILELQIQEITMDIAELDSNIAILNNNDDKSKEDTYAKIKIITEERQLLINRLNECKEQLDNEQQKSNSLVDKKQQEDNNNTLFDNDNKKKMMILPNDTYTMLREIISEKMKANVIGTIIENISLLDDNIVLGGIIILQRQIDTKQISILGESIQVVNDKTLLLNNNDNNDNDNDMIIGGEIILVECHADEAIGMSISSSNNEIPLYFESQKLFERIAIVMKKESNNNKDFEILDMYMPLDPELSIILEGQASSDSTTERVLPVRLPRSSISFFDTVVNSSRGNNNNNTTSLFPVDNPIQSLKQYDSMSIDDKVRTLLGMSNYDITEMPLPRPRILRRSGDGGGSSSSSSTELDDILIPLIDESVRMEYNIRQAERNGDKQRVQELQKQKSKRMIVKEKAQLARDDGLDEIAEAYETEAEFLSNLRADITQDEGNYSKFLDRDDWYERERQKTVKRIDKSKFGNLLDGID